MSSNNKDMSTSAGTLAAGAAPSRTTSSRTTGETDRILRVRAAPFARRLAAVLVDAVLLGAVTVAVTLTAAVVLDVPLPTGRELGPDLLVAGVLDRNPMALGGMGLFFGLGALYQLYLVGVAGQTLGLRLVRLRVISVHGTLPGPLRGLLRFVALGLSVMPAGLGWLWCLFDRERRALHDHLAGTFVVVDE